MKGRDRLARDVVHAQAEGSGHDVCACRSGDGGLAILAVEVGDQPQSEIAARRQEREAIRIEVDAGAPCPDVGERPRTERCSHPPVGQRIVLSAAERHGRSKGHHVDVCPAHVCIDTVRSLELEGCGDDA